MNRWVSSRALALALALAPTACIPSNVVAEGDRAVAAKPVELKWDAPLPRQLDGLYEAVTITGDIAQAMWRAWYQFAGDGEFSGAALVLVDGRPQFQTLTGRYRIDGAKLQLGDDSEPAEWAAAEGHIKISSAEGTLVLRKVKD